MDANPLLLMVQANVRPDNEADFNHYYQVHVPTLMKIPGYVWGRRYVGVRGESRYLAAYEIAGPSHLENLLGPDPTKRNPLANSEFTKFGTLEGLSDVRINVYRQISGAHLGHPLLQGDYPISVVTMDCKDPSREAAFNEWYTHSHVPNLLQIPGYVSGARFELVEHPALAWLEMGPRYLALYELSDLTSVPSLADPETMRPEAAAEFEQYRIHAQPVVDRMSWNIYRPLAKHWPTHNL